MKRVRLGVIGCGAIAPVQHLPFLSELAEEFEVAVVCDVSPSAAKYSAGLFHVPKYVTDYQDVLASDVDAVLLCHTDPKTDVAVASFRAGKHVFIEKPMCYSLQEADSIVSAARDSGKVGQVGYVKLYEPAFEAAQQEVAAIHDVRFVQVNHLHPSNELHIRQFRTRKLDDVPAGATEQARKARQAAVHAAIAEVPEHVQRAFGILSGSMIHALYALQVLFGVPSRVVSTEIWSEGHALTTTLEYPQGHRCVATWVDLPELWDFHETLEVYGGSKRVIRFLRDRLLAGGVQPDGPGDRRGGQDRPQGAPDGLGESVPARATALPRVYRDREGVAFTGSLSAGRHRSDNRHHQELPGSLS